jgi:2-oxoglutarate dehydrogenase E2 component (dihydrolipoamide succinyltransferase)
MAIVEVKVPQLSESVAEATMLQWKKKPGDAVAQDEILIEIETDKVVLEVPAPSAGVLGEIVVADGGTVVSGPGDREDRHRGQGECCRSGRCQAGAGRARHRGCASSRRRLPQAARSPTSRCPPAAKMMADNSVPAGAVAGTGRDGRVTKGDVIGALASGVIAKAAAAPDAGARRRASGPAAGRRARWPRPTWVTVPSSACPCRACAPRSPSACCSRSPPTPS